MAFQTLQLIAFNRGRISRLALARTDVKRAQFSADLMTNWVPRVMGSMSLRAGWGYKGNIPSAPRKIPFVFSTTDTAIMEFTNAALRVWVNDALVTRVAVGTAVVNGDFNANLANWTNLDEGGGTSAWVAGGYMGLTGDGTNRAIREQQVAVAGADQAKEHGIRIVIQRGPVMLRIGTTTGDDNLMGETELGTGTHSLAVTPNAANIFIRFFAATKRQVLVDSCNIEAAGVMSIPSPYLTADLGKLRYDQSADVVYLACYGYQQRKVERRSTNSWSIVRYAPTDGPLRDPNVSGITLTPSALSGNITVTASKATFKSTQAPSANNDGSIFRISSNGQQVSAIIAAQNTFTGTIQVEGVGAGQRTFTISVTAITGTGSTSTLQRSLVSATGPWTDVENYVADTVKTLNDGLDNQIVWYRVGVKAGNYVAGNIVHSLTYNSGSVDGYVRVTAFTSSTQVSAEVLTDLGGTAATDDWAEGEWSDRRGWPSAGALDQGRLWWAGKNGIWGSISDGFESFDDSVTGDSGVINRDVGSGPLDNINWMLPVTRLILGAEGAEMSCKSSSLDEPLTPTNFQIKADSTQGSADVQVAKLDKKGIFVQRGGTRIYELDRGDAIDYAAIDLTILIPEICSAQVSRMAIQRQPDTRIHCVLADGTVAMGVIDRVENVLAWFNLSTRAGDTVVDVCVLPGTAGSGEDAVYYTTARAVNGGVVYHLQRWALESECVGGTVNKQADDFVTFNQAASANIAAIAPHLVGCTVVVWADGKCLRDANDDIATFVVAADGSVNNLTNAGAVYQATQGMVGLAYSAQWKSTKLGSGLNQRQNWAHLGVVLDRTHHRGLRYGQAFDILDNLPLVEGGTQIAEDTIWQHYDEDPFEFSGEWDADSRLCLQADAPRPCTILAATLPMEEKQKR